MPETSMGAGERADLVLEVTEAFTTIFVAADCRQWDQLRAKLADSVRLDWTSLSGGEPAELTGDAVCAAWRGLLGSFDATHHQLGNFTVDQVDEREARLRCYGTATHVLALPGQDGRWTLGARYHATLRRHADGWRAVAITMTAVWGEGNQNLLAVATARAQA